jgi:hypothetical protein
VVGVLDFGTFLNLETDAAKKAAYPPHRQGHRMQSTGPLSTPREADVDPFGAEALFEVAGFERLSRRFDLSLKLVAQRIQLSA